MIAPPLGSERLIALHEEARARTLELVADLDDERLWGPRMDIVNPILWEMGHVAWFHEKWILRHLDGRPPLRDDGDCLWDSMAVLHDTRWDLKLPRLEETRQYMAEVGAALVERLAAREPDERDVYHHLYALAHEDMHAEAFTYMRQTLGYSAPALDVPTGGRQASSDLESRHDVSIDGGRYSLGAEPGSGFVHDNEKWAHPVELGGFRIASTPVTCGEYLEFVEDRGYRRRELWSEAGWKWREEARAEAPVYWARPEGRWHRRRFDRWVPVDPDQILVNVGWFEADAYSRWAGRRLPTEAEWEVVARGLDPGGSEGRAYPWGDDAPTAQLANLDWLQLDPTGAGEFGRGESRHGCRQLVGEVWEWTASDFLPYPGFTPDMYADYSRPWFGTRKVLRGGSFATRSRMIRNTWRNYYTPDRRDVYAGFRTCAR